MPNGFNANMWKNYTKMDIIRRIWKLGKAYVELKAEVTILRRQNRVNSLKLAYYRRREEAGDNFLIATGLIGGEGMEKFWMMRLNAVKVDRELGPDLLTKETNKFLEIKLCNRLGRCEFARLLGRKKRSVFDYAICTWVRGGVVTHYVLPYEYIKRCAGYVSDEPVRYIRSIEDIVRQFYPSSLSLSP